MHKDMHTCCAVQVALAAADRRQSPDFVSGAHALHADSQVRLRLEHVHLYHPWHLSGGGMDTVGAAAQTSCQVWHGG